MARVGFLNKHCALAVDHATTGIQRLEQTRMHFGQSERILDNDCRPHEGNDHISHTDPPGLMAHRQSRPELSAAGSCIADTNRYEMLGIRAYTQCRQQYSYQM